MNANVYITLLVVIVISCIPLAEGYKAGLFRTAGKRGASPQVINDNNIYDNNNNNRGSFNFALNSMGTDQIERPEDEDSPEFKLYLKALLKMQATRAKSGMCPCVYVNINYKLLLPLQKKLFMFISIINLCFVFIYNDRPRFTFVGVIGRLCRKA